MDNEEIPMEARPEREILSPRLLDGVASPHSVTTPCAAQNGKVHFELSKHAAFLDAALDKYLCSRDAFVEQLQSNQKNLIRILETMECSQPNVAIQIGTPALQYVAPPVQPSTPREANLNEHVEPSLPSLPSDQEPFEPPPPRKSLVTQVSFPFDAQKTGAPASRGPAVWKALIKKDTKLSLYTRTHFTLRRDYEIYMGCVIVASSAYVGWEVQYAAETSGLEFDGNRVGAAFFLAAYFFDLAARIYFQRCYFFRFRVKPWNLVDVTVFAIMLLEECLRLVDFFSSLVVLRILRFLRLLRVLHVARLVKRFRSFRILMRVVQKSIVSMAWVLVLCGLGIYFFALAIVQGSLEHCKARERKSDPSCDSFGKLSDAALNLFKAMFGGELWGDLYDRSQDLGMIFPIVFLLFISLSAIVIMNVITGVVLEIHHDVHRKEMDHAGKLLRDKRSFARKMQMVFEALDINVSGGISVDELRYATADPRMGALLESMGLDVTDVDELFELLDLDKTGSIDVDEFVLGGLRMHGIAKTSDIMKLSMHIQSLGETLAIRFGQEPLHEDIFGSQNSLASRESGVVGRRRSLRANALPQQRWPTLRSGSSIDGSPHSPRQLPQEWKIIEDVEMRAMRIRDLRAVEALMARCCTKEKWTNPRTGDRLDPNCVNLYHFNYYVISPCSTPEGISLSGLRHDLVFPGAAIFQKTHTAEKIAKGEVTDVSASGAIHVRVTRGRFQTAPEIDPSECCIIANGENVGLPSNVEMSICLSYKEAFHPQSTKPMWFCSHWWGEAICDFVACCEQHAALRAKGSDASYWICAYANRQSELATDMSDDPDRSSFRRAMTLTEGTLLILDDEATPFRRIWCDFELYNTLSDGKLLDIVTICDTGGQREPQLLSQGLLSGETILSKTHRETKFPIKPLVSGLNARLEDGAASVQGDKEQILRCIGKDRETGQPGDEAALAFALQRANRTLHSYLAIAAWPQALKKRVAGIYDPNSPLKLGLPEILSQDVDRRKLHMSFAHLLELGDADMRAIAKSFPTGLLSLHLSFEGCSNISDESMASLGKRIPPGLQELVLDFVGCRLISDDGLASLAVCLPQDLRDLRLDFALCNRIGLPGLKTLASNLPRSLVHFAATFQGTEVDRKFESVQELHKFCKAAKAGRLSLFSVIR